MNAIITNQEKRVKIANLCVGIVLLFCTLFSIYKTASVTALVVAILFLIAVLWLYPQLLIKYLPFVFGYVTDITAVSIIELYNKAIWMPEIDTYSHFSGSLPLLVLGYWFFINVLLFIDKKMNIEQKLESDQSDDKYAKMYFKWTTALVFVVFFLMFVRVCRYPSFIMKVDRFGYAEIVGGGRVWKMANNLAPILVIFPVVDAINRKTPISISTVVLYVLYMLWIGNKFGPFFLVLVYICYTIYIKINVKGAKYLRKTIEILTGLVALLVGAAILIFSLSATISIEEYVVNRLTQQGQLWWRTYDLCDNMTHVSEYPNEIQGAFSGKDDISQNVDSNYGIYKIMYYTTSKDKVDAKISRGSRYTQAGFATPYYYFGAIGVIAFAIFSAFVVAFVVNQLIYYVGRWNPICTFVLARLFIFVETMVSMHVFTGFFGLDTIMGYVLLIIFADRRIYERISFYLRKAPFLNKIIQ